ncbi:MAG: helix-turn-helix transcriptional regulator [Alphaproteobacteria bacterium]|nr:helix-turn-helix transcriptional regulator [Alphaproteobacteria bacterium]
MSEPCSIDRVIGSRLKQKRVEKCVESKKLSYILGVTEDRLLEFECGQQRIDAQILYKICKVLDLNIQYFFEPWNDKGSGASKAKLVAA